ncbi:MAG: type II secretion system F family protein [Candidatus Aenigmarchaeota archaeon]|nr:type II secretion system F family protein [Candidatus Aenigmarchaeota archaeon]MDW8149597.1 type II secretion system F family protein [Candidatus Aenigmarchaeota archaeon]
MKPLKKEEKILIFLIVLSVSLGTVLEIFNFLLFAGIPMINFLIHISAVLIIFLPIFLTFYLRRLKLIEMESVFIEFLKDMVENVRGGSNIYQSLQHLKNTNYKSLTPYIRRLIRRTEMGVPFEKAMILFSEEVGSKLVSRIVLSLIESHNFGGNIIDTMESLSQIVLEIEKMKEERKTYVSAQQITGYLVFFMFLGIIIGMDKVLFPQLTKIFLETSPASPLEAGTAGIGGIPPEAIKAFEPLFRDLILIQGIFSGILIGKMAEGSFIAGIKHSFVFSIIGISAYYASKLI